MKRKKKKEKGDAGMTTLGNQSHPETKCRNEQTRQEREIEKENTNAKAIQTGPQERKEEKPPPTPDCFTVRAVYMRSPPYLPVPQTTGIAIDRSIETRCIA